MSEAISLQCYATINTINKDSEVPEVKDRVQAKKHLKDILLLFSIPVGIVVLIVAFLYVPRLFANPTYDFIYCKGYSCDGRFRVDTNGNLTSSAESTRYSSPTDRLHYYDAERDATRPIQLADALNFQLDPSSKSPEGYSLVRGTNNGGFLFYDSNREVWSLKKGIAITPISLQGYDITFIGWVVKDE